MIDTFKTYAWALYLGVAMIAVCHLTVTNWRLWFVLIPTVIIKDWGSKPRPKK